MIDRDGQLVATEVLTKSGHRTIRVFFPKEEGGIKGEKGQAVCAHLRSLGCWHEGRQPLLLAVDIAPTMDIQRVIEKLDELAAMWEYGDPQPERGTYAVDPDR